MKDERREELRTMIDARRELQAERDAWTVGTWAAFTEIARFGTALGRALGDISRDEAVDTLKRKAAAELERLR